MRAPEREGDLRRRQAAIDVKEAPLDSETLEAVAKAAAKVGRILMECGASVGVVHEGASLVASGLGADQFGIRVGYASLAVTVESDAKAVTLMSEVGRHGVNHRLDMAVRALAKSVAEKGGDATTLIEGLDRLVRETPHYPPWLVALATGAACAAFGRLLGMDWLAFAPVLVVGAMAQRLRHGLTIRGVNVFVVAAFIAFVGATAGGFGARLAGSASVGTAMMASILMLVPGVPATNAQTDIMEGFPTVGSARAVSVAMVMVFAACGIWCADALLGAFS